MERFAPEHRRRRSRRGRRHGIPPVSAMVVWVTWFILTAAFLLALCVLLTLAWPTP